MEITFKKFLPSDKQVFVLLHKVSVTQVKTQARQ